MSSEPTDLISVADRVLDGITPGSWEAATAPADGSDETPAEYVAATLRPDSALLYVVCAPSPDPERWAYVLPAITGDGPTSRANAAFIAAAPDLVRRLRDALVAEKFDHAVALDTAEVLRQDAAMSRAAIERVRMLADLAERDTAGGVFEGIGRDVAAGIRRAVEDRS